MLYHFIPRLFATFGILAGGKVEAVDLSLDYSQIGKSLEIRLTTNFHVVEQVDFVSHFQ